MSNPSVEWTKVLIHPFGLVGYVLFLVFGFVARAKRRDEKRWLYPSALAAAGIVLIGALEFAYLQVERKNDPKTTALPAPTRIPTQQQQNDHIRQNTTGANSPNVQGVQGGTVSIDYSGIPKSGKNPTENKPALKKNH
jgi:hypothetical protein